MAEWKISSRLTQPAVSRYIRRLRGTGVQRNNPVAYDACSRRLLDELFALLRQLKPVSENGVRSLWLRAERGTIEDFAEHCGSFERLFRDGTVESHAQYEAYWRERFPDEIAWYALSALGSESVHSRTLFVQHAQVVEQDGQTADDADAIDIAPFAEWLVESVGCCMESLREGSYNTIVERELPAKHRTGTILRRDYWALYPEEREQCVGSLTREETDAFLACAADNRDDVGRLTQMTADDFFRFCAMGYGVIGCEGAARTPREQYLTYADSRHGGLTDIAPDSPEAFDRWYDTGEWLGAHPWEICRRGTLAHITLSAARDQGGYFLRLAVDSVLHSAEAVRFFLALHRAGLPVVLLGAELMKERLRGTEKVGVVPCGIVPLHCRILFPNERVADFVRLPDADAEKMAALCTWQPLTPAELA